MQARNETFNILENQAQYQIVTYVPTNSNLFAYKWVYLVDVNFYLKMILAGWFITYRALFLCLRQIFWEQSHILHKNCLQLL
jgi:hypothetical protein